MNFLGSGEGGQQACGQPSCGPACYARLSPHRRGAHALSDVGALTFSDLQSVGNLWTGFVRAHELRRGRRVTSAAPSIDIAAAWFSCSESFADEPGRPALTARCSAASMTSSRRPGARFCRRPSEGSSLGAVAMVVLASGATWKATMASTGPSRCDSGLLVE